VLSGRTEGLLDQQDNAVGKTSLQDRTVGLLGIGTGLGHAIARVGQGKDFSFVTDGHASKLRVKVDDADWPVMEQAMKLLNKPGEKPEIVAFDDHTVRAEDLFRDPVVKALIEDGTFQKGDVLRFAGKYVARLIALIKSGESTDVVPENGWSAQDKRDAAQTSLYLISGGLGASEDGKILMHHAAEELNQHEETRSIRLVQVAENAAARAAAVMALAERQTQQLRGRT
jgi:hypothetical protein